MDGGGDRDAGEPVATTGADGSWTIPGRARVDEIAEATGVNLPDGDLYDTISGLILARLERPALIVVDDADDRVSGPIRSAGAALRGAGIRTEADYQGRSLKSQFKQADKLHATLCVVLGPDEVAAGVATIRDMATAMTGYAARVIMNDDYSFTLEFLGETDDLVELDLSSLTDSVNLISPAHLRFIIVGLTWERFEAVNMTWQKLEDMNMTWERLEKSVPIIGSKGD